MLTDKQLKRVVALRQRLHDCPERSGREVRTMALIRDFLNENTTLDVQDRGGWLLAIHREGAGLPSIGFRADMDALPAEGAGDGARHGCGHDGHSAILCALALLLEGRSTGRNVCLIFQGAEETGEGARRVCESWPELEQLSAIYGLHNIPGFSKGAVLIRDGCFACASCGHITRIQGRPAHAAYPGDGANPIEALCRVALEAPGMIGDILGGDDRLLMRTLIGLRSGGENFGLSASEGQLNQTLRGHRQADIDALVGRMQALAEALCREQAMRCEFELRDVFPDTTSDPAILSDAIVRFRRAGLDVKTLQEPMRWSEDFGWYLKRVPGCFFGIGAGEACPGLHTRDYCFDDALIAPAASAFEALL